MSIEARPAVLSPTLDPEADHIPTMMEFVNPLDQSFSTIIMKIGVQYKVMHHTPMPATYRGKEVLIHAISGTFNIARPKNPEENSPAFYTILDNATVDFSYVEAPQTEVSAETEKYYFNLTTDSSIEKLTTS